MTTMTKAMKLAGALLGLMLWGAAHAGTVTYVYTDPQGTPLAEADASGNITARFEYTPYGVSVPSMGAAPNGVGYTGHVNDPETGLVYMQARYYDAEVGRFPSVDPVGPTPGNVYSFSRYAYTNDNPVSFIDPSGMKAAGFGIISDQDCAIFHCENSYSSSSGDDGRDAPRKNVSSVVVDSSQGSNKTIVEIWYKSIGGNSYNHAFIVVTSPDGQRSLLRGGPSGDSCGAAGWLASDSMATDGHS
jgi:RHS repeat-associated protein